MPDTPNTKGNTEPNVPITIEPPPTSIAAVGAALIVPAAVVVVVDGEDAVGVGVGAATVLVVAVGAALRGVLPAIVVFWTFCAVPPPVWVVPAETIPALVIAGTAGAAVAVAVVPAPVVAFPRVVVAVVAGNAKMDGKELARMPAILLGVLPVVDNALVALVVAVDGVLVGTVPVVAAVVVPVVVAALVPAVVPLVAAAVAVVLVPAVDWLNRQISKPPIVNRSPPPSAQSTSENNWADAPVAHSKAAAAHRKWIPVFIADLRLHSARCAAERSQPFSQYPVGGNRQDLFSTH